ncbi:MAG: peptide chain release factor 2 [Alphaproteobacteria bacterium]|nr:peptide chain release factor 2 [Alphaproteobacteria bacterium]
MKAEFVNIIEKIKQSLALLRRSLDYDNALLRLEELNALSENPDLWSDSQKALKITGEKNRLEDALKSFDLMNNSLIDYEEMAVLSEDDEEMQNEIFSLLENLQSDVAIAEIEALFSGEADANDAYVEIHAGSGGTEAQDWAEMLLRMYIRWAEKRKFKVEYQEETEGDVAGIKSVTIKIGGHNAYGWLKYESGVHRLVRISPFDSAGRRHTSFASVNVFPVIDDKIEININEADCRIDTYRASGAGGQHINKTDSAVRITHIPTGIVVQSQNQRSQFQNRDNAWKMLKARLYELEMKKREDIASEQRDNQGDNGWGYQIRSYVLQPYRMVKDLRTEVETSDCKAVLDGDIDMFLQAALSDKVGKDKN